MAQPQGSHRPFRGRPFLISVALLAVLPVLLFTTLAGSKRTKPRLCPDQRYLVQGTAVLPGDPTPEPIAISGKQLSMGTVCAPRKAMLKATGKGTQVSATWPSCTGLKGKVKLRATIAPSCEAMSGLVKARRSRLRAPFAARPSTCGDGVVDAGAGEQCDSGRGCAGGEQCNNVTCRCTPPVVTPTTTTSTPTPSTTTTLTSGCFTEGGDGTIHDTCRGLQWEKKTTAVGSGANPADLHDVDNRYSWAGCCNGDCSTTANYCQPNAPAATTCAAHADGGTQGCSTCPSGTCVVDTYGYGAITTVWDWLNQVNAANFAGHNDWRLPLEAGRNPPYTGLKELETILLGPYYCWSNPCINPSFGPTASNLYWSTSSYTADPDSAWTVLFSNGFVGINGKAAGFHVRAVR